MVLARLRPSETRAQDLALVNHCSLDSLPAKLPLAWPTPPNTPPSPKRRYRSSYTWQRFADPEERADWEHLSDFDLVFPLVDFSGLRPVLASLLGWTSARGRCPFDPVFLFLFVSWQLVNGWNRAQALRHLNHPRYADYRQRFGFAQGCLPTEDEVRYFLTTSGQNSAAAGDTITIELEDDQRVHIAVQYLNRLIAGSMTLLCDAGLVSPEAWQKALVCPHGMIRDAASRMRCAFVQASCYQPSSVAEPRPCPAKLKGKPGRDCDTLSCALSCRRAPNRDPQARSIVYSGANHSQVNSDSATNGAGRGRLRYGYRSLPLQFAEPSRRFSLVLLDDFLPANGREENHAAALLMQLKRFYPDLQIEVAAGDAGLGYFSYLHTAYQPGANWRKPSPTAPSAWCAISRWEHLPGSGSITAPAMLPNIVLLSWRGGA